MTTVTWWTRDSPAPSVRVATQDMGSVVGSGEQPKGGSIAVIGYAFQAADAVHADRVTDADRTGEAGRAVIGDRDLERAGLADQAFQVACLFDADGRAALGTGLAERIDDVVSGGRAPGAACAVLEAADRSETATVTSKWRLVPGVMTAPGIWHDSESAGTGPQAHSAPSGVTVRIWTGVPAPRIVAASATRTGPVGAAVPALMTVMRQDTAAPATAPLAGLRDAQRRLAGLAVGNAHFGAMPCCWSRSVSPGMAFTSAQLRMRSPG